VKVDVEATFDFGPYGSLKRGIAAGLATYFVGRLAGMNKKDARSVAWDSAGEGASTGLTSRESIELPPSEVSVVLLEVDTQSLFGNNRKMQSVRIERFDVSFPEGDRCTPACLDELRNLGGAAAKIRQMYQRACSAAKQSPACAYLKAIDADNKQGLLRSACHGGAPPNFEGACVRMKWADWLHPD
jgi:hypothetical protein